MSKSYNELEDELKISKKLTATLTDENMNLRAEINELKLQKAKIFVLHIKNHLNEQKIDGKVVCKICEKDIDQIYEEFKKKVDIEDPMVKAFLNPDDFGKGTEDLSSRIDEIVYNSK